MRPPLTNFYFFSAPSPSAFDTLLHREGVEGEGAEYKEALPGNGMLLCLLYYCITVVV